MTKELKQSEKKWYQSKTLWAAFGTFVAALGNMVAQYAEGVVGVEDVSLLFLPALFAFLRVITKESLTK